MRKPLLRLLAILLVLAIAAPAHAERRNLKIAGIICTFVGAGLFLTGVILVGASYADGVDKSGAPFHGELRNPGGALIALGIGGMGAGIAMWVIGARTGGGGRATLTPTINGLHMTF